MCKLHLRNLGLDLLHHCYAITASSHFRSLRWLPDDSVGHLKAQTLEEVVRWAGRPGEVPQAVDHSSTLVVGSSVLCLV